MKSVRLAFLGLLAAHSAFSQTKPICPWLNVATASGVLRDNSSSPVATLSELSATMCNFTYRDGAVFRSIRITVEQVADARQALNVYKAQCSAQATPLTAIGNEAWMCVINTKDQPNGERVVGRVRDQVFTVVVSTNSRHDRLLRGEALEEKARNVAEAVAGSLF